MSFFKCIISWLNTSNLNCIKTIETLAYIPIASDRFVRDNLVSSAPRLFLWHILLEFTLTTKHPI